MKLEEIVKMYGWNDYMDMHTGYIYVLSKAIHEDGTVKVPVTQNGVLIGYANMAEV